MAAILKMVKVLTLPTELTPSTLYLIKDSGAQFLNLVLTDKDGIIAYRSMNTMDITGFFNTLIGLIVNQPEGIAGLDSGGNVTANALTASKLQTARTVTVTGAASGYFVFDGSSDVEFSVAATEIAIMPVIGALVISDILPDKAKLAFSFSDMRGYGAERMQIEIHLRDMTLNEGWAIYESMGYNPVNAYMLSLNNLTAGHTYQARLRVYDLLSPALNEYSDPVQFNTASTTYDSDSAFIITGVSFTTSNIISLISYIDQAVLAASHVDLVTSKEMVQQVGQNDFAAMTLLANIIPYPLVVKPDITGGLLHVQDDRLRPPVVGDRVYLDYGDNTSEILEITTVNLSDIGRFVQQPELENRFSPYRPNDDDISFIPGPTFPTVIAYATCAVINNYAYIFGGMSGSSTYLNTIYRATINEDGFIGSFSSVGTLPVGIAYSIATVLGDKIYLIGGRVTGGACISTIYYATINPDGTLSSFSAYPISLPITLMNTTVLVANNRLHVIGGSPTSASYSAAIYTATIGADGLISDFILNTAVLPSPSSGSTVIKIDNTKVIIAGGQIASDGYLDILYTATVTEEGDISSLFATSNLIGDAMSRHEAMLVGNRLIITGGKNKGAASYSLDIRAADIADDGTVGLLNSVGSLLTTGNGACVFVTRNYMTIIGCYDGSYRSSTQYTLFPGWYHQNNRKEYIYEIGFDRALSQQPIKAWYHNQRLKGYISATSHKVFRANAHVANLTKQSLTQYLNHWYQGNNIQAAVSNAITFSTSKYVYMVGGNTTLLSLYSAGIQRGTINANGTVGSFAGDGSFPVPIAAASGIVTDGRVTVLGGITTLGLPLSSTYYATINADGTIGTWSSGDNLPAALAAYGAVTVGPYLYLLGGQTGSGTTTLVLRATVGNDGVIGSFSAYGTSLPAAVKYACLVNTSSYVYLIGGLNGSNNPTNAIYRGTKGSDGSLTGWTQVGTFPINIAIAAVITTKDYAYILAGHDGSSYLNTVYRMPIDANGVLGSAVAQSPSLPFSGGYPSAVVTERQISLMGYFTGILSSSSMYHCNFEGWENKSLTAMIPPENFVDMAADQVNPVIAGYQFSSTVLNATGRYVAAGAELGMFDRLTYLSGKLTKGV